MMHLKEFYTSFQQQPRWMRISVYLLTIYTMFILILGVLTPYALQSIIPTSVSKQLGRNVTIDDISINPFLLRIRVENLVLKEEQDNKPFIRIALIEADAGFWQSLFHLTPTLEHAYISAPYVHLIRRSGGENTQFNFSDIMQTLAASSSEKAAEASPQASPVTSPEPSDIAHIKLGQFKLEKGHLKLSDEVTGTELDYPELGFTLNDLDTLASLSNTSLPPSAVQQNEQNAFQFNLITNEGGSVYFDGQFQLLPLQVSGNIELNNIALAPMWPLSNDLLDAKITDGFLALNLNYFISQQEDAIHLKTNNSQLTVSQLAIADNERTKISINSININDVSLNSKNKRIDIGNITIDSPHIDTVINNQGVDLVSMFTPNLPQQVTPDTVPSSQLHEPSWDVVLASFNLSNGNININEALVSDGMHWQASPLHISTGIISNNFNTPIDYQLNLALAGNAISSPKMNDNTEAANITSQGSINVNKQHIEGSINLNQFALNQLQSYLKPYVNVAVTEGFADLSGSFEADTTNTLSFNGQANIASLNIVDGLQQQPLVKWKDMNVSGIQYQSDNNALTINQIKFLAPYARLLIDENKQTNITDIVVNQESNSPQTSSSATPVNKTETASRPMVIDIGEITLEDGSAYFADNSLIPRFASGINSLNGAISALSSTQDTAANVDISGKIDGYAPVALKGALNPLLENVYLDLNFSVNGAELTSVNPYSGTYMGHYIDKGLLSLDVTYHIQDNQLSGSNHVVIDQLTLGRKTDSDQALNLPLGLAIALLEDSDGVIDLGLEVSGDLDNPSFGFGALILNALGNLITKAVTAPFSLLANLVGSEDELNEISFTHGSSQLNDNAKQKLSTLANALAKRPGLRVNIEGTVDDVADAYELAEQKLQQQLKELSLQTSLPTDLSPSTIELSGPVSDALISLFITHTNKDIEEEREIVKARLQQNNTETPLTPEQIERALHITMYNQTRNTMAISNQQLAALANNRAKAIKTYLVNKEVDANRLFILNSHHNLKTDKSGVVLTLDANE